MNKKRNEKTGSVVFVYSGKKKFTSVDWFGSLEDVFTIKDLKGRFEKERK